MNSISPASMEYSPGKTEHRVYHAAQEFEALLLASLLRPLEQSFSSLAEPDSGSDDYHYMGIQALAGALSKSGGIGIADLLARQLLRTEVAGGAAGNFPGSVRASSR